ncbi:putative quinol monooxygenase [Nguyenibacter vanlangensis]|uniref:Antibiotic biosynthesis monooxygenase n=1 Tax=Nguyenibacter vanlangensis TaxID=1216886 RepID=A0A7Y7ITR8_9PROT|nr:putative quinol monooxygenase [Nguyenibacter vanlangensis]NVN09631.1 antibiotic biosynthesis monooxygenase [Nguyenibacter vanlangensis]
MDRKPFTILVGINLKPGYAQEFLALLDDIIEPMRREESFIDVVALQNQDDPDSIVLYETWLDRHEFETVQRKRDYRRAYEERLPQILREPRTITFFDAVRDVRASQPA